MAITRSQIAKQLLAKGGRIGLQGGGADMGAPDRAQERADRGYGDPRGGLAARGAQFGSEKMALEKGPDVKQNKIDRWP